MRKQYAEEQLQNQWTANTTDPTPPTQHYRPNTTHPTLPTQHHRPNTTDLTPPTQHYRPNTADSTLPTQHYRPNTTDPTLPTQHHRRNTTDPTLPTQHHRPNTTDPTLPTQHAIEKTQTYPTSKRLYTNERSAVRRDTPHYTTISCQERWLPQGRCFKRQGRARRYKSLPVPLNYIISSAAGLLCYRPGGGRAMLSAG